MFGLQGYVTEHQFTIMALLIDRSLGYLGLHMNFFYYLHQTPTGESSDRSTRCMIEGRSGLDRMAGYRCHTSTKKKMRF
jgi:hypothetical protein